MLSRLQDIQLKLSDRDRKIVLILVIAILLLGMYWTIFRWFLPEYTSLKEVKQNLEADISGLQMSIGSTKDIENKMVEKRNSINESIKRFDWQVLKGDPLLVLGNQAAVTDKNFQLISLIQGEIVSRSPIWEAPYTIRARGNMKAMQEYLTYLDEQDKAFQPEYLRIDYFDSFETMQSQNLWLELQISALGSQDAEDTKERLIDIERRSNIFLPTVTITPDIPVDGIITPPNGQTPIPGVTPSPDGTNQEEIKRTPRYTFPTRQEVQR